MRIASQEICNNEVIAPRTAIQNWDVILLVNLLWAVLSKHLHRPWQTGYVTRKTEHAGKLKPFQQRGEMSGYVTRKTEHGGRLKPSHRVAYIGQCAL